jgi:uncharacterized protein
MSTEPLMSQVLVLSAIAVGATVLVYGLVAGIVKLDDLGMALNARANPASRRLGHGILVAAPVLMKSLSILGTAAMFTVGGSILAHGVPAIEHVIEGIVSPLHATSAVLATVTKTLLDALVGIVAGGVAVGVMLLGTRLFKKAPAP